MADRIKCQATTATGHPCQAWAQTDGFCYNHQPRPDDPDTPIPGRCTARLTDRSRYCSRPPMPGQTVCRVHGGAVLRNQIAAARKTAERDILLYGNTKMPPIYVDPKDAILKMIAAAAGRFTYWQNVISEIESEELVWSRTSEEQITGESMGFASNTHKAIVESKPHIAYQQLQSESDRIVRYSQIAIRAGIEERRVKLAEEDGMRIVMVLTEFLSRLGMDSDLKARTIMGEVVREVATFEVGDPNSNPQPELHPFEPST